ncbi:MAG: hypothetical protein KBC57_05090 [Neisseriaceae bacterium]|nr:hypothetical protein [Neisseriaceae bacterium]
MLNRKRNLFIKPLSILMGALLMTGSGAVHSLPFLFNDDKDAALYKDVPNVALSQVYNELKKNEATAKKKWSGQVIAITGTVVKVEDLKEIRGYRSLTAEEVGSDCTAMVATKESTIKKQMKQFPPGSKVRIYGIINDMYLSKSLFAPSCIYNLEVGRIEAAQ